MSTILASIAAGALISGAQLQASLSDSQHATVAAAYVVGIWDGGVGTMFCGKVTIEVLAVGTIKLLNAQTPEVLAGPARDIVHAGLKKAFPCSKPLYL